MMNWAKEAVDRIDCARGNGQRVSTGRPRVTLFALALVLASAFAHATWNYLAKSSQDKWAFSWTFNCVSAVVYLPVAVAVSWSDPPSMFALSFIVGTVALHVVYFSLLAASYARADLSIVYPVARGTGLLLIPVGAWLVLGERISFLAAVFILVIFLGVLTVHTRGRGRPALAGLVRSLRSTGSGLAALTGVVIASYSLWDKNALTHLHPIVLDAGIFAGLALVNAPFALLRKRGAVLREVRGNRRSVVAAGILSPLAYLLVLSALTISPVAYVGPAREIGIVVGTLLGAGTLKEPYPQNRLVGSVLIVLGVFGLALLG